VKARRASWPFLIVCLCLRAAPWVIVGPPIRTVDSTSTSTRLYSSSRHCHWHWHLDSTRPLSGSAEAHRLSPAADTTLFQLLCRPVHRCGCSWLFPVPIAHRLTSHHCPLDLCQLARKFKLELHLDLGSTRIDYTSTSTVAHMRIGVGVGLGVAFLSPNQNYPDPLRTSPTSSLHTHTT
jgi:hypothetical protein